jgi:hypothetical protein
VFASVLGSVWPQDAFACAVCFGDPQAPVTKGMNLAVLAMLGLTLGVLGGFVGFMIYLARRSARAGVPEHQLALAEPVAATVASGHSPRIRSAPGGRRARWASVHGAGRGHSREYRRRIAFPDEL